MNVEMRLSRIIINEINDLQYVYLQEVEGPREFPIVVGMFEAICIDKRVRNVERPRPQTHDLLVNAVNELGAELDCVIIHDLDDGTYFANLRVRRDGQTIDIDARPSDAIAVAVSQQPHLPIYVADQVIEQSIEPAPEI